MKWYHQQEIYYGQVHNTYFKYTNTGVVFSDGGVCSQYKPNETACEVTDPELVEKLEKELIQNIARNEDIYKRHYETNRYSGD